MSRNKKQKKRAPQTMSIKSVSELIQALKKLNSSGEPIWFRGQSNTDWKLQSAFDRLTSKVTETTLIARFQQSAAMLVERSPASKFDWLFLMQHYGVPTRLLDWTESPLVALYFSVAEPHNQNTDAALWVLYPVRLNKHANVSSKHETHYIPSFDSEEIRNYTVEAYNSGGAASCFPLATIATRNNSRIQAQLGVFTISHQDKTPIEEIGDKKHVIKFTIPASSKRDILNELKILSFSKFQMFPELSSIGEIVKEGIK